jgi:hypothetical protein
LYSLDGSDTGMVKELTRYCIASREAELKGPSGTRDHAAEDALQTVGLIPGDYKLVHAMGRLDEHSFTHALSLLK